MSRARTKRDVVQPPELNDTKAEADRLTSANEQLKKEITERARAEDRVRLIIDTIPVMAWSVRPDGIVDFLNQRWMDYTGLSLGQYVADPTGQIHREDTPRVLERWRAQMARGEAYDDEMRLRGRTGHIVSFWFGPYRCAISPEESSNGMACLPISKTASGPKQSLRNR